MPLYEYKCKSCGTLFEVRQKFVDEPLKTHDACGGEVERLISVPSLNFKGTGWYVTDYGTKSANGKSSHEKSNKDSHKESGSGDSATKSESKSETKSEAKSESKSESKSETKSESKPAAPASSSSDKKS